jgi:hypothetical protein
MLGLLEVTQHYSLLQHYYAFIQGSASEPIPSQTLFLSPPQCMLVQDRLWWWLFGPHLGLSVLPVGWRKLECFLGRYPLNEATGAQAEQGIRVWSWFYDSLWTLSTCPLEANCKTRSRDGGFLSGLVSLQQKWTALSWGNCGWTGSEAVLLYLTFLADWWLLCVAELPRGRGAHLTPLSYGNVGTHCHLCTPPASQGAPRPR